MNTLDVLIAARAEVEKGWCKKDLEDSVGNVCVVGAIERVTCGGRGKRNFAPGWSTLRFTQLWDHMATFVPQSVVQAFNDDPSTTKADVLALFDRAINAEAAKVVPVSDPAHVHTQAA